LVQIEDIRMTKVPSSGALLALACAASLLAGCNPAEAPSVPGPNAAAAPAVASDLRPTAGIQDIMAYMIDPAADFLWESVSTTVTEAGTNEHQPRTDEEWDQVRKQAIILTEAANLIMMEGRHVARGREARGSRHAGQSHGRGIRAGDQGESRDVHFVRAGAA
jgi:hypothetical protein